MSKIQPLIPVELSLQNIESYGKPEKSLCTQIQSDKASSVDMPSDKPQQSDGSPPDKDASSSSPTDQRTWAEFTQNTTFHGVKYIFEQTPFRFRR